MANRLKPLRIWRERMWWMPEPLTTEFTWQTEYDDPATSDHPIHIPFKRQWTKEQIEHWCRVHGYEPHFDAACANTDRR
jgi:hypothetical protein